MVSLARSTRVLAALGLLLAAGPGRAADNTWTGAASATWNTSSANWTAPTVWNNNFFNADGAVFGPTFGATPIAVAAGINARSVDFGGNGDYTLSGGPLVFSPFGTGTLPAGAVAVGPTNTATLTLGAASNAINATLSSRFGLSKLGDGTLELGGTSDLAGSVPLASSGWGVNLLVGSGTGTSYGGVLRPTTAGALPASVGIGSGVLDIGAGGATLGMLTFANTKPNVAYVENTQGVIGSGALTVPLIRVVGNGTGWANFITSPVTAGAGGLRLEVGTGGNGNRELMFLRPIGGAGGLFKTSGLDSLSPIFDPGSITLAANNTYTGPTVLNTGTSNVATGTNATSALTVGGTAILTVQGAGQFSSAGTVRVLTGSTLTLSNSASFAAGNNTPEFLAADVADRLSPTAAVVLDGGTLALTGAATGDVLQTVASLTAPRGFNRINLTNGTGFGAVLTVGSLSLPAGSTLVVGASGLGTTATFAPAANRVVVSGALPAEVNGIIPGLYASLTSATGVPTTFARNSPTAGVGLVGLEATDYGALGDGAGVNAGVTAVATLAASGSNNAVRTGFNITLASGATLTVGAGGLLTTAAVTVAGPGTLAFGANPGLLMTNSSTTTYSAPITGTAGLVRSGAGTVALTGDLSGLTGPLVNAGTGTLNLNTATFAGPLNVLGGTLATSNTSLYATTGGAITLGNPNTPAGTVGQSAVANLAVTGMATVGRNIATVGGDGTTPYAQTSGNALTLLAAAQSFTGTVSLASPLALNQSGAGTAAVFSGLVSGTGGLELVGSAGTVTMSNGGNTFSGGVRVNAGTLIGSATGAFGTGPVVFGGGTVQSNAVNTFSQFSVLSTGTLNTNGNAINVGAVNGENPASTFTKSALTNGTLTVTGAGTYPGTVAVGNLSAGSGGLTLSGGGALPLVASLQVLANATLTLDNTGSYLADRVNDRGTLALTGAGAVVRYVAPVTAIAGTAEQFGLVNAAAAGGVFSVTGSTASTTVVRFGNLTATGGGNITLRGDGLGATNGSILTRIFIDSFTSDFAVIPNVFYAATAGTGTTTTPAGYDFTGGRGIILFTPTPVAGTSINNLAPDNVPLTAAYTTNGNATATTGVSVFSLTLDGGSTLTLNGGNAASAANGQTPDGTLNISGGQLTSQNGPKSIVGGTATTPVVSFGASQGLVTTTSDLTISTGVTLGGTGGLTKLGTGTLTVNGPYSVTGATTVSAGTLAFGQSATVENLSGAGGVSFGANTLTVSSTAASTFSGPLTGTGSLVKSGTGVFTLSPASAPTLAGGTTVGQGTLLLGNTNAATTVLGGPLTLGAGTTGGTVDLNGFSPAGALASIATGGTSVANGITNSNATTTSTVALNFAADTSVPVQFGGNLVVNKNDATTLTLTGNAALPATTTGVFNVNAGTLLLTTSGTVGLGSGMSVNVASGAVFRQTNTTTGGTGPFGTVTLAPTAEWQVTGVNWVDPTVNRIVLTGGRVNYTGTNTAGTFINFALADTGRGIYTNASSTQAQVVSTATADLLTGSAFVVQTAQGTVPSNGADLQIGIRQSIGMTKTGPGTLELVGNQTASTGALTVSAGTVRVTTGTGTGAVAVNGGVVNGVGTVGGATTVNAGAFIQGGDPTTPTGALAVNANLTLTNTGGLRATVGASAAGSVNVSLAAGVLNLNPGVGNRFVIDLVNNPADPLAGFNEYTVTLASVATAGNIQLNGTSLPDGVVPASNYTLTGVGLTSGSLSVSGSNLVLVFTPVPEPATVLAVAGLGLGAVRLVRRRKTVA